MFSLAGSVIQAAWSFMLAARNRGIGTVWTTVHLALEQEVARLQTVAPAEKPATRSRPHASLFRVALAVVLVGAGVAAMIARDRPTVAAAPAPVEQLMPTVSGGLRECIAVIAPVDDQLDETTTDPHGAAEPTAWIAKTGASCRAELSKSTDPAVRRWADAEDKLADPISLITVYYGSDPYTLDHYGTAPQLWRGRLPSGLRKVLMAAMQALPRATPMRQTPRGRSSSSSGHRPIRRLRRRPTWIRPCGPRWPDSR